MNTNVLIGFHLFNATIIITIVIINIIIIIIIIININNIIIIVIMHNKNVHKQLTLFHMLCIYAVFNVIYL